MNTNTSNRKLILIRGIPGSGKSTLAKQLQAFFNEYGYVAFHFEADQFFVKGGVYQYDGSKIGSAHGWCQHKTYETLAEGNIAIVSNTFTTVRELRPYFEMAKEFGIVPTVLCAQNEFENVHSVPKEVLEKMTARFQHNISVLFKELND